LGRTATEFARERIEARGDPEAQRKAAGDPRAGLTAPYRLHDETLARVAPIEPLIARARQGAKGYRVSRAPKPAITVTAIGLQRGDAAWLRNILLAAARCGAVSQVGAGAWGTRWRLDVTVTRQGRSGGKNHLDCADRPKCLSVHHLSGALMKKGSKNKTPCVLDVVALLADLLAQRLARGQVGTIVEELDYEAVLVEFSDEEGRAYSVAPCPRADLLVLHYVPQPA
jgi:hypothetical protein